MNQAKVKVCYTKKDVFNEGSLFERIWDNPELLQYSEKQIIDILTGFNKHIGKVVTTTREGVALPLYMGILMAGTWGDKPVKDHGTSAKVGKDVDYKNHHSDGYGGAIYYVTEATKSRFALGKFWGFTPVPYMSQSLKDGYMTNWKLYAHIPNSRNAYKLFKQAKIVEFAKGASKEMLEYYDEFDFDT